MEDNLSIFITFWVFNGIVFSIMPCILLKEKSMNILESFYYLASFFGFPMIIWGFYNVANVFNIGGAIVIFLILSLLAKKQVFLARRIFTSYLRCIISIGVMCIIHYLKEDDFSLIIMSTTLASMGLIFFSLILDLKAGRKLMN